MSNCALLVKFGGMYLVIVYVVVIWENKVNSYSVRLDFELSVQVGEKFYNKLELSCAKLRKAKATY